MSVTVNFHTHPAITPERALVIASRWYRNAKRESEDGRRALFETRMRGWQWISANKRRDSYWLK